MKEFRTAGFLKDASDALIHMFEDLATEITLENDEVLFRQGDTGDAVFAVMEGALEISVLSAEGRKLSLDLMRPGAICGEIALFDPGERTATVTSVGASRLRRLRNAEMLAALRKRPELAEDMIRLAGQRMRWMNAQLQEQVFLPLPVRLARKALYLSQDGPETSDRIDHSQARLAEYVGATREAVAKTLAEWKRAGVIQVPRGAIVIRDRDALATIARGGPV